MKTTSKDIPLLDCPSDFLIGDASGKIMNEYGRFPCKIKCCVYAFMVKGSARAHLNVDEKEFKQNDFLIMEPGTFLLIDEFSEDALVYYILFSSNFMEKYAYSTRITLDVFQKEKKQLSLSDDVAGVCKGMFDVLLKALNCDPPLVNNEIMLHVFNLLQIFCSEYYRQNENYLPTPMDRKVEIYQEYQRNVLKHYHEWHHVAQYADDMRLSLPHLCSTIKAVSGKTAGDIIDEAILTEAKAQLKITNLQVKEIAISLGFDNVAFFNRFFKAHIGMTPKSYRNA